MSFSAINSVIYLDTQEFTTSAGDNDNVSLASSNFDVTCTANNDRITGFIPPENRDGAQVWITNLSPANKLIIPHDTGSTAGFRFILTPFTEVELDPGTSQHFGFWAGIGWLPIRPGLFV